MSVGIESVAVTAVMPAASRLLDPQSGTWNVKVLAGVVYVHSGIVCWTTIVLTRTCLSVFGIHASGL